MGEVEGHEVGATGAGKEFRARGELVACINAETELIVDEGSGLTGRCGRGGGALAKEGRRAATLEAGVGSGESRVTEARGVEAKVAWVQERERRVRRGTHRVDGTEAGVGATERSPWGARGAGKGRGDGGCGAL